MKSANRNGSSGKGSMPEKNVLDDGETALSARSGKTPGSRSTNEKKRRDKQQRLINEISTLIPDITGYLDKASILRSAISYLKCQDGDESTISLGLANEQDLEALLSDDDITQIMIKVFHGFILVIDHMANVLHASSEIESVLPLQPAMLIGRSVLDFIHPDDCGGVHTQLMDAMEMDEVKMAHFPALKFRLLCSSSPDDDEQSENVTCIVQHHRVKAQDDKGPGTLSKSLVLLACMDKRIDHGTASKRSDAMKFCSRHSMDGRFISIASSSSFVTGLLPSELIGTSWYDRIHSDDLHLLSDAHRQLAEVLYEKTASVTVRFLAKGNEWVTLDGSFATIADPITMAGKCIDAEFTVNATTELWRKTGDWGSNQMRCEGSRRGGGRATGAPANGQENRTVSPEASPLGAEPSQQQGELFHPFLNPHRQPRDQSPHERMQGARGSPAERSQDMNASLEDKQYLQAAEKHMQQQLTSKLATVEETLQRQRRQLDAMARIVATKADAESHAALDDEPGDEQQLLDYLEAAWKQQEFEQKRIVAELMRSVKNMKIQERMQKLRDNAKRKKQSAETAATRAAQNSHYKKGSHASTGASSSSSSSRSATALDCSDTQVCSPRAAGRQPENGKDVRPQGKRKLSNGQRPSSVEAKRTVSISTSSPVCSRDGSPMPYAPQSPDGQDQQLQHTGQHIQQQQQHMIQQQQRLVQCRLEQHQRQEQHQQQFMKMHEQQHDLDLLEQLRLQQTLIQQYPHLQQLQREQQQEEMQRQFQQQLHSLMSQQQQALPLPSPGGLCTTPPPNDNAQLMTLMASMQQQLLAQLQSCPDQDHSRLAQLIPTLRQMEHLVLQDSQQHTRSPHSPQSRHSPLPQPSPQSFSAHPPELTPLPHRSSRCGSASSLQAAGVESRCPLAADLVLPQPPVPPCVSTAGYTSDGGGLMVNQLHFPHDPERSGSEQSLREGKMPASSGSGLPKHEQKAKDIDDDNIDTFDGDFMTSFQHQLILLQKEQRLAFIGQQRRELNYFSNNAQMIPVVSSPPVQSPFVSSPPVQSPFLPEASGPSSSGSAVPCSLEQGNNNDLGFNFPDTSGFHDGLGFSFTDLLCGEIPELSEEDEAVVDLLLRSDF